MSSQRRHMPPAPSFDPQPSAPPAALSARSNASKLSVGPPKSNRSASGSNVGARVHEKTRRQGGLKTMDPLLLEYLGRNHLRKQKKTAPFLRRPHRLPPTPNAPKSSQRERKLKRDLSVVACKNWDAPKDAWRLAWGPQAPQSTRRDACLAASRPGSAGSASAPRCGPARGPSL